MCRYLLILLSFFLYSSSSNASIDMIFDTSGGVKRCQFDPPTSNIQITADPVLANIGDQIGTMELGFTATGCDNSGTSGPVFLFLSAQPYYDLGVSRYSCKTTLSSVSFETTGGGATLWGCRASGYPGGPVLGTFPSSGPFPIVFNSTYPLIKRAAIPPGILQISLVSPGLVGLLRGSSDHQSRPISFTFPPGEIIGTACSLATTNVLVDFGEVSDSDVGRVESFEIGFDSCTDQADAMAFNDAVSLSFHHERVRGDGAALQNGICANCAEGIQVGLQDGRGTPINLNTSYALSSNPSVVVGQNSLNYTFGAQLQNNPDESRKAGAIDTQLIFETIVE